MYSFGWEGWRMDGSNTVSKTIGWERVKGENTVLRIVIILFRKI